MLCSTVMVAPTKGEHDTCPLGAWVEAYKPNAP